MLPPDAPGLDVQHSTAMFHHYVTVSAERMYRKCDCDGRYWNKFYPEGICELISCYGGETMLALEAGPEHKAQKKEVVDGELRYKYDMAIPAADLNFKYGRPWGSGRG